MMPRTWRSETLTNEIPEIDIHGAKQLLDTEAATFVDIRDPDSHAEASIRGAEHLTDQNVQRFIETTDKARPLVVYCYHGNSSQQAVAWLQSQGFAEVFSLRGGFEAWRQAYR